MTLALGFVTVERPSMAQRLVRSIRRWFPSIRIHVADQSRSLVPMSDFYEAFDVHVTRMPFDAGLSASRNALVDAIEEDHFVLCDDDFVLGPLSDFTAAVRALDTWSDLGVVGGRLHDWDGSSERIRNWEMFLDYDRRHGRFTAVPIYNYAPVTRWHGDLEIYLCDAVMNFAVFRRALFSAKIRWDERIKVNGEHEDFYLNLRLNSDYRVAYLPSLCALHHHDARHRQYRHRLRSRSEGWATFRNKWGITQHLEVGSGGRSLSGPPASWFLPAAKSSLENGTSVRELMPEGVPAGGDAGIVALRLRSSPNVAGPRPVVSPEVRSLTEALLVDQPAPEPYAHDAPSILFRHAPMVGAEEDFHLWYRPLRSAEHHRAAALRFRWYGPAGDVLLWEEAAHTVDLTDPRYWRPLLVPLPVSLAAVTYLRFDVVADRHAERVPVATGFVLSGAAHQSEFAGDALALTELDSGIRARIHPGRLLTELAKDPATQVRSLSVHPAGRSDSPLLSVPLTSLQDLETIIVLNGPCMPRAMVSACLVRGPSDWPTSLLLPSAAASRDSVMLGHSPDIGFCRLALGASASGEPGAPVAFCET